MPFRIILFSLLLFLALPVFAAAAVLEKIAIADNSDLRQVFFSFSELPRYDQRVNGKRIDLRFFDAEEAPHLTTPAEDGRIIKVLRREHDGVLQYSFFLRYPPQKTTVTATGDKRLVLDITLGNDHSASNRVNSPTQPFFAKTAEVAVDNPLAASPYRENWLFFFQDYESGVDPVAPMLFSLPPYPLIALLPPGREKNIAALPPGAGPADVASAALAAVLLEAIAKEQNEETKKLLALTYGEALARAGQFDGAYKQLYLLVEKYGDEQIGIFAAYLLNRLQAQYQDAGVAYFSLKNVQAKILPGNPLAPWFRLLQIETALASGNPAAAGELLQKNDVAFPPEAEQLRGLRQGDYLAATGKDIQAFVRYQLAESDSDRRAQPFSQNGYCNILYTHRQFAKADACYGQLAEVVSGDAALAMSNFRQLMARLHAGPKNPPTEAFARIAFTYAGTEGGLRAAMKNADLMVLADRAKMEAAHRRYQEIFHEATKRDIRAEAAVKMAITSVLQDKSKDAVPVLMDFLRDDRASGLRDTAIALLIQYLPGEIRRLTAAGQAMDALILAKQNRELFVNRWLDSAILVDVAKSYQELGIWTEAQATWLYLLEITHDPEREAFFLPLVAASFQRGEYGQAVEYAAQYAYNYPDGRDREAVLRLRLSSLLALRQYDKILSLLPKPLPDDREIRAIAATVYFQRDDFQATAAILQNEAAVAPPVPRNLFMLAESRYRLSDLEGAAALFHRIEDDGTYGDQATYRLAEIARSQGDGGKEIKYLQRLTAKNEESPWRRFAQRALEARQFTEKKAGS